MQRAGAGDAVAVEWELDPLDTGPSWGLVVFPIPLSLSLPFDGGRVKYLKYDEVRMGPTISKDRH